MSILTASEQMARPIGEELGASNDVAQAALLNGFCEMLNRTCGPVGRDTQIAFFTSKLSPTTRRVLVTIAAFCEDEE